ncbi:MAG: DeoR/GlpR transcriptional regulator [Spirochaetaceae bacterium]|nr:MAG: DeoR/GlpR transcriptional regulator [Spirochaetaceae bacterium]
MDRRTRRLNQMLDILRARNAESIRSLSQALGVSQMTVRRDVAVLAEWNLAKTIHGGVILNSEGLQRIPAFNHYLERTPEYHLPTESGRHRDEKARIARKAASLIEPGDIIILDSGSTTEHLAQLLPSVFPITVICYTLGVLIETYRKRNCEIIFPGGYFHANTLLFESREGVELMRRNRANKGFFAAGGVSRTLGVTCSSPYAVANKRAALESSQHKVLLVDSSKFGGVRAAYYASVEDFDTIITDNALDQESCAFIQSLGVELITV